MNVFFKVLSSFFIFYTIFLFQLRATEVVVTPSSGENFSIEIEPTAPFLEVVEEIQNYLINSSGMQGMDWAADEKDNEISFSYAVGFPKIFGKKEKGKPHRSYAAKVSPKEKEHIRFIILSLAKKNWAELAMEESTLKGVGDKINHVHPLRFLECVFTDEELKTGIFVIRNKSLVWGGYYDGIKKSLNDESDLNNLVQFVPDFANNLGVNVASILPYVQARQWSAMIDVLIQSIPRQGNPDRYDM